MADSKKLVSDKSFYPRDLATESDILGICKTGDIQALENLIKLKALSYLPNFNDYIGAGLFVSCTNGKLEMTKHIIKTHVLPSTDDDWVNHSLSTALCLSCSHSQLNIIKYLLQAPKLREKVDINCLNASPLRLACDVGNLKTVKYLTSCKKLITKADIDQNDQFAFRLACNNRHIEIIRYFIYDLDIQIGKKTQQFLDYENKSYHYIIKMLCEREKKKLDTTIKTASPGQLKTHKI